MFPLFNKQGVCSKRFRNLQQSVHHSDLSHGSDFPPRGKPAIWPLWCVRGSLKFRPPSLSPYKKLFALPLCLLIKNSFLPAVRNPLFLANLYVSHGLLHPSVKGLLSGAVIAVILLEHGVTQHKIVCNDQDTMIFRTEDSLYYAPTHRFSVSFRC